MQKEEHLSCPGFGLRSVLVQPIDVCSVVSEACGAVGPRRTKIEPISAARII